MNTCLPLKKGVTLLTGLAVILGLPQQVQGQSVASKVKAAFLYNFAKYVEWPDAALSGNAPIVIGIVGKDSLDGALDSLVQDKTVNGHRLVVKHLRWSDSLGDCQELFVPEGEMSNASHLEAIRHRAVLIVGESQGFARSSGEINFVEEGNRIRFEINDQVARQAGLRISSKLLSLGKQPS